jgi:hypothetical protein
MNPTDHYWSEGAKQPKSLRLCTLTPLRWFCCVFQVQTRGRFGPHALKTVTVLVLHRLPRTGFHNLRQAEAAIRLWIKTVKEDGLEIPQPRGRLVYA